jgi:alanyl-tRNA synthetase
MDLKEFIKNTEKDLKRHKEQDILSDIDAFISDHDSKRQIILTENLEPTVLKQLIDAIYDRIKAETILLVNVSDDKATFLCKSARDNANLLIKKAAELTKGSGGGKPQFAQGGTQELSLVRMMIEKMKEEL